MSIKMSKRYIALGFLVLALTIIGPSSAKCTASGCGGSGANWEASAQAFLSSDVPLAGISLTDQSKETSFKAGDAAKDESQNEATSADNNQKKTQTLQTDYVQPAYRSDLFIKGELLKSLPTVSSSDIILDVSNSHAPGDAHIRGAIHIPSKSFLYENGTLRPALEIAKILGDAGISQNDPIVVYSDSFRSGEATFVLWMLKYLGHEDVKALDGGLDDWTAASLPLETRLNTRNSTSYTPIPRSELLADYGYVKSGTPQMVDVRTFEEFGKGRIPQAFFIEVDSTLENGKVRPGDQLNDTFAKLNKDRPTVVYSTDLFNSSLVWYALQLMGFDSRIYSWQDWQGNIYEI